MTPIISYLKDDHQPSDPDEARKIKKQATKFMLLNDALYKRGFSLPYLRCVEEDKVRYILKEVHEGICRDHTRPRSLISKITRMEYFWPTMWKEAKDFIKRCDKCQKYGNAHRILGEKMTIITSLWPFAQWDIDIVGPLSEGKRQVKFFLVIIDYFTKWIEVEALATITKEKVQGFVWKNIVCKFGILRMIISDNLTTRRSDLSAWDSG